MAKFLPLVWSGLWRKPARSIFTLLSISVAFVLFGILAGVDAGFAHTLEVSRLDRLFADPRFDKPMPISYADQIAAVPGVTLVAPRSGIFGYYQDPKNPMFAISIDRRFFALRPEIEVSAKDLDTLLHTRTGALVSIELAQRFGWKVGDKVPIQTTTLQADGNPVWTFDVAGIIDDRDHPGQGGWFITNYVYLDEARVQDKGTVSRFLIRIKDAERGAQIGREVDKLFANSAVATRTSSERSQTQSGLQFFGDVNFLTRAILGAVFFMLLLVSGNTMLQSVRERLPELAVLKAIGFSDSKIVALVFAESLLLCLAAATLGLLVSEFVIPLTTDALSNFVAALQMPVSALLRGLALALTVALISALLPAWRARSLSVAKTLSKL